MLGNVLIFGDSYSTFEGYIPEGYDIYYYKDGRSNGEVTSVEETWWHRVITEMGGNLVRCDSWSGSAICYTGYFGADRSETSSFVGRFQRLKKEGFFEENRIDTVFIFGGTNDDWCGAPEGELKYEGWTNEDMYCALPAIGRLFCRVAEILPHVNVYAIINTELKPCINDALIEAATRNGVKVIRLSDIDKIWGHPSDIGMTQIKDQLLAYFEKEM